MVSRSKFVVLFGLFMLICQVGFAGKTHRILVVPSGAKLGYIPLKILEHMEGVTQKPTYQIFDEAVGTSAGSWVIAALNYDKPNGNAPYTAKALTKLFPESANKAFGGKDALEQELTQFLGGHQFKDAKIPFSIFSYCLDDDKIYEFISNDFISEFFDYSVKDLVTASCCVKSLFGSKEVCGKKFIDAGSTQKNSMTDPSEAIIKSVEFKIGFGEMDDVDSVIIYTIHTGFFAKKSFFKEWKHEGVDITHYYLAPETGEVIPTKQLDPLVDGMIKSDIYRQIILSLTDDDSKIEEEGSVLSEDDDELAGAPSSCEVILRTILVEQNSLVW